MTTPASPSLDPSPAPAKPSTWSQVVAGREGTQRQAIKRLFFLWPGVLILGILLLLGLGMGLAPVRETHWLFAYGLAGFLSFYGLLRSGVSRHWREPLLVFPQTCFYVTLVVLAYVLVPWTRELVVQWLCLLILFDMRRLSARQVLLIVALAYGLLMLAMLMLQWHAPGSIDSGPEVVNIGMAAVTLGALMVVTRVARRVEEQRKAQRSKLAATVARLDELAIRDALTGALNRRHAQALLQEALRRHARSGRPCCVAMLDIDHFKRINDGHGHAVGDAVLREVAQLLVKQMGGLCPVGRWGGEEFVVLMPEHTLAQAEAVLAKAAQAVREHGWQVHAAGLTVSFSGGLAQHRVGDEVAHLLERADQALYAAKTAGRDRIDAER